MGIEYLKCYFELLTHILYWGKYTPLLPYIIKAAKYLISKYFGFKIYDMLIVED